MTANVKTITPEELVGRNKNFLNCHEGKRCFIIGNGPSISGQDLTPLTYELTFVVNSFWEHPLVGQWQPTYCCIADPLYFDERAELYQKGVPMPMERFFSEIRSRMHSTVFFIPLWSIKPVLEKSLLPLERTFFIPYQGLLSKGISDIPDITKSIPSMQSVSQMAMMVALYMGCSPLYLLGCDHDWFASWGHDSHFYGTDPCAERRTYRCELDRQLRLWLGYEHLMKVASVRRIRILNATNGGFLDVFERVKYEDVIQNKIQSETNPRTISEQEFQELARGIKFDTEADRLISVQAIWQAINRYPDSPNLYLFEAGLRFKSGDLGGAKITLSDFTKRWPNMQSEVFNTLGAMFWKIGDTQNAANHFAKALEINPPNRNAVLNYGKLLAISGKSGDAGKLYTAYLQRNPADKDIETALTHLEDKTQKKSDISLAISLPYIF